MKKTSSAVVENCCDHQLSQQTRYKSHSVLVVMFLLSLASCLSLTTENLPIGLLMNMRDELHTSESHIGLTVTGYAFIVALTAAPLMRMVRKFDRKHTLLGTLFIYTISCLGSTFATDYTMLLFSRLLGGLAHGVFWALIAVYCAAISPPEEQTKNLSVILAGGSLGFALGVPGATWIGQQYNWRIAFGVIGIALLAITVIAIKILLTSVPESIQTSRGQEVKIRSIPGIFPMLACVGLVILGQFTVFTYITEFFQSRGMTNRQATLLLLFFGLAGIVGLYVGNRFSHVTHVQRTRVLLWVFFFVIVAVYFTPHSLPVLIVTLIFWGMVYALLPFYLQPLAIDIGGTHADVVSGMYVGIYNLGIGMGALLGGALIDAAKRTGHADHMQQWLFFSALLLIAAGAVSSIFLPSKHRVSANPG